MKQTFAFLTFIFASLVAFSQAPNAMSYQAVIRDASNKLVSNQSVSMQISILQGSASDPSVYTETQTLTTNANGLASMEIGSGTIVLGSFSAIDWANGPYFIKTETDPTGGSTYTITGTSQLLSVPYAMHAKTAENTFSGDYDDLNNKPTNISAFTNDAGYVTILNDDDATNELQNLSVSTTGDTLYLQNGGFVIIPGISAANTPFVNVHCTGTPTAIVDVINPTTGKTWMDRNLGASQVATSGTDADAYGDLYQWGRRADGHHCRNSSTTSTLSSTDQPGHGEFITPDASPFDWRSPHNGNLWQGVNGINNPCPSGYRLPTFAELDAEHNSWISDDAAGAFASPLKLQVAGYRYSNGSLSDVGSYGNYWSSTVDGASSSFYLFFKSDYAIMLSSNRPNGLSVRCLKD